MKSSSAFARITAITAIVSMPLSFGCLYFALAAVGFDVDAIAEPSTAWVSGARAAEQLRRSMLLDMLGYYLLLVPGVLWIDRELRRGDRQLAPLVTACGLGYVLVGAVGAATLAAVCPRLLAAHARASVTGRETIAIVLGATLDAVHGGLWNLLEMLLGGVFWSGAGAMLLRRRPRFAALSLALGAAAALDGIANALGLASLASIALSIYLVLAPGWALCLGIIAAREPERARFATRTQAATV